MPEEFSTKESAGEDMPKQDSGEGVPVPAISPLDPDWILMLLFAIFVDLVDAVLIIIGFFVAWTITPWISLALDIIVGLIIGGWMFWRTGEIIKTKRQRQQALVKKLEKQAARLKKLGKKSPAVEKALQTAGKQLAKFARPLVKTLGKVGIKTGISLAGETGAGLTSIPVIGVIGELIGLIPFWTITVFMMLGERGE